MSWLTLILDWDQTWQTITRFTGLIGVDDKYSILIDLLEEILLGVQGIRIFTILGKEKGLHSENSY